MGEWLTVGPSDNRAYLATPESGTGPGVLVLHAWWGLTSVFTGICDRLAANGFTALAPSLYPDGATAATIPEAETLIAAHDRAPDVARGIALAAIDRLRGLPAVSGAKIGVIGFSMGAYWAFHLSGLRSDQIGAVVAFYGAYDGDLTGARAAYLGHYAENDEYEDPEWSQALESSLRAAGHEVTFHTYPGTKHWFVEPSRPDEYDAEAAELAWERTIAFLKAQLA
jgi:carboxymethylenebutenolidase